MLPEGYSRDHSQFSLARFEQWAQEALQALPSNFRNKIDNVAIFVQDEPDLHLLRSMKLPRGSTLFGVYQGIPLNKRGHYYMNVMPDQIIIFRRPILRFYRTEASIKKQIRDTLIHEIGHHFGMTESEIQNAMG
ncbi:metallopeptidase family protein [bacterium]|nr:metallopeptidase family protein [candidate division CSSED10-310 bacterium]